MPMSLYKRARRSKNVTTGEFETMFKQFLRIKELIKELKANEEKIRNKE